MPCPSARQPAHQIVDFLLRPDVDATRRIVQQKDSGIGQKPFRDGNLLLVPAAEKPYRNFGLAIRIASRSRIADVA